MNQIITIMKSYLAFFLLLMLLLNLVPRDTYKKYIRFFMGLMLALTFLYPVLSILFDQEDFFEKIQYEEFLEELDEMSQNAEKIEFSQESKYIEQYKQMIEADVKIMAENNGFSVTSVKIDLTKAYEIASIDLGVTGDASHQIIIGKILVGGEEEQTAEEQKICEDLKDELMQNYQLGEEQIRIQYE